MTRIALVHGDDFAFPPVEQASPDGVLAVGGIVSPLSIRRAYRRGIFPWPVEPDYPILWFCPEERCVFDLNGVHVSRSLARVIKQQRYEIRFDTAFDMVMRGCASPRANSDETWIDHRMFPAYSAVFHQPVLDNVTAHSIEAWRDGRLVGGLYGLAIGGVFTGESMFHTEPNASKVVMVALAERMRERGFTLFDAQVWSDHLGRMGAVTMDRKDFLRVLHAVRDEPCVLA